MTGLSRIHDPRGLRSFWSGPQGARPAALPGSRAVVFLSTSGDVLTDASRTALRAYLAGGGGFLGVHGAATTEYAWPWYGGRMGADHPVVWCHERTGGRSFYTALGHTPGAYADPVFRRHLLGALTWTARPPDADVAGHGRRRQVNAGACYGCWHPGGSPMPCFVLSDLFCRTGLPRLLDGALTRFVMT